MSKLAELETSIAKQAAENRRKLVAARAAADEALGARLRDLVAPGLKRAAQVEAAAAWLDEKAAELVGSTRVETPTAHPIDDNGGGWRNDEA